MGKTRLTQKQSGQDSKHEEHRMSTAHKINTLWEQFRAAIDATYADGLSRDVEEAHSLRDYAQNISWHDDLAALLGREAANERQHRRNSPHPRYKFTVGSAAKLILMHQAASGSKLSAMPSSTLFLVARQTAVEAEVIGYLCREHLTEEWRKELGSLDYAKLMSYWLKS
jgi:hypothetical protein